jgi:hypothetical protein
MGRHLFIVTRLQSWFYDYLVERFADDPNVTVIRDRRVGERRRFPRGVAPGGERRRGERRRRQHLDVELQTHSHIIVELND